jgi:peroxiredoxin
VESNGQRRTAIIISLLAVLLAIGAAIRLGGGEDEGSDDAVLPSVELTAAGDVTISTDDLVGAPLVINFWYSACPPCANELRDFAAVHQRYGDEVRFVGVNAIDTIDEMTAFAGERGVTYELYQDRLAELQTEMRLTSFPTTLFVAADGSIIKRTGVLDESSLENEVIELLVIDS